MYYKITEKGGSNFLIRGSRHSYKKVFTEQHVGFFSGKRRKESPDRGNGLGKAEG